MIAPSVVFTNVSEQLSIADDSLSTSPWEAFMSAKNPDIAFFPAIDFAVLACSASLRLENAPRQSARMSDRSLIDPSAFVTATVVSPIASPPSFAAPASSFMMDLSDVPA